MATNTEVKTPDFGGAGDVEVIEVLVKPGDELSQDTAVITLESEKATMEVPAGTKGIVKEIKVKVGDKLVAGDLILTLEGSETKATQEPKSPPAEQEVAKPSTDKPEQSAAQAAPAAKSHEQNVPAKTEKASTSHQTDQPVLTGTLQTEGDVHAGPGVRRMARELGVNLAHLTGSGPKKRILKEDVQTFVKQQLGRMQTGGGADLMSSFGNLPVIDFSKFGTTESKPLSRIKKISGKNLQRNWMMIPHVTQFGEADITELEDFRQAQKAFMEKQKIKLTPLVFIMKAVVASLKMYPQFNSSLDPTGEHLIYKQYFHIGVAVDTPDGLVVPVVRDVDKKSLLDLAQELTEVSEKARKKQLTPVDMQGGCFSISSLGGIGGTAFTPIINYPEVAILGVSKSSYQPVWQNHEFVPRLMLPLSLSYDHRVIDGADGARFIVHLTNMLTDIRNLLM